jgi:hypothetical protein
MKASDIIQGLAELIAVIQRDEQQAKFQEPTTTAQPQIAIEIEPANQIAGQEGSEKFVPPLQAKLELLKKATGVASTYDGQGEQDELGRMKQMAGIQQPPHSVVADEAGTDEPFEQ